MYRVVSVVGCGAFGYALGLCVARAHPSVLVKITDHHEEYVRVLRDTHRHPFFHSGEVAPPNLLPVDTLEECLSDAELLVYAVQAQKLRGCVYATKWLIPWGCEVLSVAKALEEGTDKRMSEVIAEELDDPLVPIGVLSGGMIAGEVARGSPVGAQVASYDKKCRQNLLELFRPTNVHVRGTGEVESVEYAAALKSVVAIGAGVCDGLGYGPSSKAFFITEIASELEHLAEEFLGLDTSEVFSASQSWVGDLHTSCYGNTRNREFGELIGRGASFDEAVQALNNNRRHAEGIATLRSVYQTLSSANLSSPFLITLYRVVIGGLDAKQEFTRLAYQNL